MTEASVSCLGSIKETARNTYIQETEEPDVLLYDDPSSLVASTLAAVQTRLPHMAWKKMDYEQERTRRRVLKTRRKYPDAVVDYVYGEHLAVGDRIECPDGQLRQILVIEPYKVSAYYRAGEILDLNRKRRAVCAGGITLMIASDSTYIRVQHHES